MTIEHTYFCQSFPSKGIGTGYCSMLQLLLLHGLIAAGFAIIALFPGLAHAQQNAGICVRCMEPDETYLCQISGAEAVPLRARQFYCVMKLAQRKDHASCAARNSEQGACNGTIATLTYDGPAIGQTESDENTVQNAMEGQDNPNAAVEKKEPGEPETLVDLTKQAVGASQKGLQKAGETTKNVLSKAGESVSSAAKSTTNTVTSAAKNAGNTVSKAAKATLNCVITLFNNCSAETPEKEIPKQ